MLTRPGRTRLRPPPLSPAPRASAGPKVHAHRAQLGRWGLLSPGTKGLQRVVGRSAERGGRGEGLRAPGLGAGSAGQQTSLGPHGRSKGDNQVGRACMTQHDLAQAPTRAQRKPRLGGARVRSLAQPAPPSLPSSRLLPSMSPSIPVPTSQTRSRPGPSGPTQR